LVTVWLLEPTLGVRLGLPADEAAPGRLMGTIRTYSIYFVLFLPGAVVGGTVGWFIIRPVNWVLGHFFRGFNWVFDRATAAYGKTVGWAIRLSVIVIVIYVGFVGLTG